MMNLSMIRRKLETTNLKMKYMTIGVQTHTKVCICYIEGIVNHKILDEVYKRLNSIDIDGILDMGYIQELMMILSLIIYSNTMQMMEWAEKIYKYYAIPFEIIFPLIFWIAAEIKVHSMKGKATAIT